MKVTDGGREKVFLVKQNPPFICLLVEKIFDDFLMPLISANEHNRHARTQLALPEPIYTNS